MGRPHGFIGDGNPIALIDVADAEDDKQNAAVIGH